MIDLEQEGVDDGDDDGGEHIGRAEGLRTDEVDADAEDEHGAYERKAVEGCRGHDGGECAGKQRDRPLEHGDGQGGENAAAAERRRHGADDDAVQCALEGKR